MRRQRELRLKSELAFFQSLQRLFLPIYFVKCRRTLQKLHFKSLYPSSWEREIKFRRCLFTSSDRPPYNTRKKAFSRRSGAKRGKKCTKTCDARTKLLFCLLNLLFFLLSCCHPRNWILLTGELCKRFWKDSRRWTCAACHPLQFLAELLACPSVVPWLNKYGKLSIPANLVMTLA